MRKLFNPATWFRHQDKEQDKQTALLAEIAKQLHELDGRLDLLEERSLKHGRKLTDELLKNSIDSDARVAALVKVLSAEIGKQLRLSEEALGSDTVKLGEVLARQIREVVKHLPDAAALAAPLHETEQAVIKAMGVSQKTLAEGIAKAFIESFAVLSGETKATVADSDSASQRRHEALATHLANAFIELDRQIKAHVSGLKANLEEQKKASAQANTTPVAPAKAPAPAVAIPVVSVKAAAPESVGILKDGIAACEAAVKTNVVPGDRKLYDVSSHSGEVVRFCPASDRHETLSPVHRAPPYKAVHALFTAQQVARLKELLAKKG
jgi:hypothetical protein